MKGGEQLGLFGSPAPSPGGRDPALSERLAREHAETAALARCLPESVRFGTSSWSFPGWKGLVYSRRTTTAILAREGLVEYARHPLLRTVGIDRGFYAPIPGADLERYAGQLPPGFPCCTKAPEAVMAAVRTNPRGEPERRPNPDFLNATRFVDEMVGPFLEVFREHTGPFILQMPPAPRALAPQPARFAEELNRFLEALPQARYAVELRDPALLTAEYRAVLEARSAAHVYNYVTAMPMPEEQASTVPVGAAPFAVIRLLLAPGTRFHDRREEFAPFDRLVAPDLEMRRQVVALARAGAALGRDIFVLVNNKAEGCSPLTIRALAEMLAGEKSEGVSPLPSTEG